MPEFKVKKVGVNKTASPFLYLCIFCILSLGVYHFSFAQDKIVAVVNNDVITQKDLDEFANFMRLQLSRRYDENQIEEQFQALKSDLLDKLIEDRLILQEAKKDNIKIDENRLKGKLNEVKSRYPSEVEFQNSLTEQGLVQADLESKIREQLLMYAIIEKKVRDKIEVRPEEVTSYYNNNIKEFIQPETREVEVIILENEDVAKSFAFNFKSGQKLEDLATRYAITLDKLKVTQREELRKDIEDVVFKLGIGEISDPIKIDSKYYVLRLDNIIASRQQALSEVQDKIYSYLFEMKMQDNLTKWLDELRTKSYIKIVKD